jgi:hypothetical protein
VIIGEFMSAVVNGEANIRVIPSIVAGTVAAATQSAKKENIDNAKKESEVKNV